MEVVRFVQEDGETTRWVIERRGGEKEKKKERKKGKKIRERITLAVRIVRRPFLIGAK